MKSRSAEAPVGPVAGSTITDNFYTGSSIPLPLRQTPLAVAVTPWLAAGMLYDIKPSSVTTADNYFVADQRKLLVPTV